MNATLVDLSSLVALAASKAAAKAAVVRAMPNVENARAFLIALRNAGKRSNEHGVMVGIGNPSLIREDEVTAISDFCGYVVRDSHGSQLDSARRLAQKLLAAPAKDMPKEYRRGVAATVAGYVAGMPDNIERNRASLEAELRQAVDEKCTAFASNDHAKLAMLDKQIQGLRNSLVKLG